MNPKIQCNLIPFQCGECGCFFGIEEGILIMRQKDNRAVFCTNGHSSKVIQENPEADRLARIVEQQEAKIEQLEAALVHNNPIPITIGLLRDPFLHGIQRHVHTGDPKR